MRPKQYWKQTGSVHAGLTVPVAGLSEGLPFGEDYGHNQVLEGGHVEERGVFVVLDVLVVVRARRRVHALRQTDVTGAAGRVRAEEEENTPR